MFHPVLELRLVSDRGTNGMSATSTNNDLKEEASSCM